MRPRSLTTTRCAALTAWLVVGAGCTRPTPSLAPALPGPPRAHALAAASPPAKLLLVFLHGYGDSADGFLPLAQALAPGLPHADLLVPDALHPREGGGPGRQWFSRLDITDENRPPRVEEAGRALSAWIDAELRARHLDGRRLVVVGFSQGAMLAQWLALRRSPAPAAVVSLGGLLPLADDAFSAPDVRVLLVHGEDDPVIPVQSARSAHARLTARGVPTELRVIAGLGHAIDGRALAAVREFLASVH